LMGGTIFMTTRGGVDFFHFCIGFSLTHLAGPLVQNNHRMQTRASANQNITHHQLCPRPRQAAPPGAMNSRSAEQPWWKLFFQHSFLGVLSHVFNFSQSFGAKCCMRQPKRAKTLTFWVELLTP
jgi:hypothetical protein